MKIVLLSGGSGKRLWPLYGETRSRQFLKVLMDDAGKRESMMMRIVRQVNRSFPDAEVLITCTAGQKDPIRRQLHMEDKVITEPERRGTYPAILLSAAYILDNYNPQMDETIMTIPVDPFAGQDYFDAAAGLSAALSDSRADIGLMAIKPTYPSEKYGYISGSISEDKNYGRVVGYVEKPDARKAEDLISKNGRWNGGIFAFKSGFIKGLIEEELKNGSNDPHKMDFVKDATNKGLYERLTEIYSSFPSISFDKKILEKSKNMIFIPYEGEWKDLGTWNTLTEKMHDPDGGRVIRGENCVNTHVINELEIPLVALGLKDTVVVASSDGILISDKHASSFMGKYVEKIDDRPMYEKRQWGEYRVLDMCKCSNEKESSLTKRLYVEPGRSLSYQVHNQRDEIWTIIDGTGYFLLDGERRNVKRGEVLYIKKGQWHSMASLTGIEFIEVQLGTELTEEDIERKDYDWSDIWEKD